ALLPQCVQALLVAQRIHRLPESAMHPGSELAARSKMLHRLVLPHDAVAGDQVQHAPFQHKEAAVDQATLLVRLLLEGYHLGSLHHDAAEARGRAYARDRCLAAMRAVERD